MSSKSRTRGSLSNPPWAIVLLVVLAIGTVALTVAAVAHGQPDAGTGVAIETPASPSPGVTETDAASPPAVGPPEVSLDPVPASEERFLLVGADGTLWRAVAGSCASGEAPAVERSTDAGASWIAASPAYLGVNQVAGIRSFNPGQAQLIVSADPTCATQGMRTYTQGQFWEVSSDSLSGASYLPPADPAAVVSPLELPPAPCATPSSLSTTSSAAALVCDSQPYLWSAALGPDWVALDAASPARATVVTEGALTIAHASADCGGVAISTMAIEDPNSVSTSCQADLDVTAPAVLASDPNGGLVIWSGEVLRRL